MLPPAATAKAWLHPRSEPTNPHDHPVPVADRGSSPPVSGTVTLTEPVAARVPALVTVTVAFASAPTVRVAGTSTATVASGPSTTVLWASKSVPLSSLGLDTVACADVWLYASGWTATTRV